MLPCSAYGLLPFTYEGLASIVPGKSPTQEWHNFTAGHVMTSLQLLLFAALAFVVLWRMKKYIPGSCRPSRF